MKTFDYSLLLAVAVSIVSICGCRPDSEPDSHPLTEVIAADSSERWQADPFRGVKRIQVEHVRRGEPQLDIYDIEDPNVVERLSSKLRIDAIQNGVTLANKPSAWFWFTRENGEIIRIPLDRNNSTSLLGAQVYFDPAFTDAVHDYLKEQTGKAVNLLQDAPETKPAKSTYVKFTPASFESGFSSLDVMYRLGERKLHRARLTDEDVLEKVHKAFVVRSHEDREKLDRNAASVHLHCKDGSYFLGNLHDSETFSGFNEGIFKIEPSFLAAINHEISRLEGRPIDILKQNDLLEEQIKKEQEFREVLSTVKKINFTGTWWNKQQSGSVGDLRAVSKLMGEFERAEVPLSELKLEPGLLRAEFVTPTGTIICQWLDAGENQRLVDCNPIACDLVELSGFWQVWVSDQWKYKFQNVVSERERAEKDARKVETIRMVTPHLQQFLPQVISIAVECNQGESRILTSILRQQTQAILRDMKVGKVEELSWTDEQWKDEIKKVTDRGAAELGLTPGIGFTLELIVVAKDEALVPRFGRVKFEKFPETKIRSAIAGSRADAKTIQLLPQTICSASCM
jgi:hypothetical protein